MMLLSTLWGSYVLLLKISPVEKDISVSLSLSYFHTLKEREYVHVEYRQMIDDGHKSKKEE